MARKIVVTAFAFCLLGTSLICLADQTDPRLGELFDSLKQTTNPAALVETENRIWEIWMAHNSDSVETLMQVAIQRMNSQRFSDALLIFSEIIESYPQYAEAWNKRATLYYLLGDYQASLNDIEETLQLEPRHFGALSGQGMVYIELDELPSAAQAFRNMLEVNPNSPSAQQNLKLVEESLRLSVI